MNREIKFRAWDKATKEMLYEWDTMGWGHNLLNPFENANFARMYVMQFTGLKDKNGKEIYEGDIVKCGYFSNFENKSERKWYDYIGEIKCTNFGYLLCGDRNFFEQLNTVHSEIIGNIYENSDLLK